MPRIYPSIVAAPPLTLDNTIKQLDPYCAGFHCDIMDNHFVPNLTFGASTVNAINAASKKPVWVHLMVDDPINWCKTLSLKSNSIVSFHFESTNEIQVITKRIKENNWKASIAINPKTPVEKIFDLLHLIDQVLIMSVEPGFSGQRFLESVLNKIAPLIAYRTQHHLSFEIGIDGGITAENIGMIAEHNVNDFAIASAIFNQPNPLNALQKLSNIIHAST
jgi:ribulose-phosphate 3-epimerase